MRDLGLQRLQFAVAQVGRDVVVRVKARAGALEPAADDSRQWRALVRRGPREFGSIDQIAHFGSVPRLDGDAEYAGRALFEARSACFTGGAGWRRLGTSTARILASRFGTSTDQRRCLDAIVFKFSHA
ncbi:hypothetical protein [Burkholderia plantarii]|uniref:hypothetical protein n=1 Tax=Burkholderia plantarii TaxID=41899 RepID=UPI002553D4AE|nr:hypothetical protein [Burkholderia plantarii]